MVVRCLLSLLLSVGLLCGRAAAVELPESRTVELEYIVDIRDIPGDGKILRLWFPVVPESRYQDVSQIQYRPVKGAMGYDERFGNPMMYYEYNLQETPRQNIRVAAEYTITRREYRNPPKAGAEAQPITREEAAFYQGGSRYAPITPEVRQLAAMITDSKQSHAEKARAIYDYVLENMTYTYKVPGWGLGNLERAVLLKSGDSTDFHSLFVALARASGVPARFIIGVPLPEGKRQYIRHYIAWAEFYDPAVGWIPVDAAKAKQHPELTDYYFGTVDAHRIEFGHGRDIQLVPPQAGDPMNFFVYPFAELDGEVYRNLTVTFRMGTDSFFQ